VRISSVTVQSGSAAEPTAAKSAFAKVKQDFQDLGKALESGNLADAQKAFKQLQADAPSKGNKTDDPMSAKMEALGKALDSGDLEGAKKAYADIQETISKRHAGGQPGGAPPAGGGPRPAGGGGGSESTTTYDVKDTNKDGTVSAEEEYAYELAHPTGSTSSTQQTKTTSTSVSASKIGGTINLEA
jgi:hypothetical protein